MNKTDQLKKILAIKKTLEDMKSVLPNDLLLLNRINNAEFAIDNLLEAYRLALFTVCPDCGKRTPKLLANGKCAECNQ